MNPEPRTQNRDAIVVALVGVFVGIAVAATVLSAADWNASSLLRVGEEATAIVEYAEAELGEIRLVPEHGHDGKYYFIQANDPFLLEPQGHADLMDRPVYRSQRVLYPLLASAGGPFGAWGVVWALLVINLIALGFGTWATARVAVLMGTSPWLGLAFALNPGILLELIIDGAGILSWALAVIAILLLMTNRYTAALVALVCAVLAREAMILVPLGLAAQLWKTSRMRAVWVVMAPAGAAVLWGLWVRLQLGVPMLTSESKEVGLPFEGLGQAFAEWAEQPGKNLFFGIAVIALLLVIGVQAARRPSLVSFSTLGFVVLAPLLTKQVWLNYFDIPRAVAPVFTTFVLVLFARESLRVGDR